MKRNVMRTMSLAFAGIMAAGALTACGGNNTAATTAAPAEQTSAAGENTSKEAAAESGEKKVLKVAMECAYAPYNWTQPDDSNGAVPINDSNEYAYGYDVMMAKKICDERILDFVCEARWIDYQEVFGKKYSFEKAVSLQEALMLCDLTQDGRMHDGLDDALNTAKLIRKLELNPEYQLICRQTLPEEESDPLNICLGDLFAGLHIECA